MSKQRVWFNLTTVNPIMEIIDIYSFLLYKRENVALQIYNHMKVICLQAASWRLAACGGGGWLSSDVLSTDTGPPGSAASGCLGERLLSG